MGVGEPWTSQFLECPCGVMESRVPFWKSSCGPLRLSQTLRLAAHVLFHCHHPLFWSKASLFPLWDSVFPPFSLSPYSCREKGCLDFEPTDTMGTCRNRGRISSSYPPLFPWDSYGQNKVSHCRLTLSEPDFESRLVSSQSLCIDPLCPPGLTASWFMGLCLPGAGTWIRGFGGRQESQRARGLPTSASPFTFVGWPGNVAFIGKSLLNLVELTYQ